MGCCQSLDDDFIQKLKCTPFFCIDHDEDDDDLTSLSRKFRLNEFARETKLWEVGATNTCFHFIVSGIVSLQFEINGNKFFVTKTPGDCFGYHALSDTNEKTGVTYSATVKSDEGARTYTLTTADLLRFWRSNGDALKAWNTTKIMPISSYIRSVNVFAKLDNHRATILSTMFTWHKIMKDEVLFEEGTPGNAFYIVARGCVAVEVSVNKVENEDNTADAAQVKVLDGQNNDDDEYSQSGTQEYNIHSIGIGGIGVKILNPDGKSGKDEAKDETVTERRVVYEFKPGDYFGEVSLVINMPRTATIVAKENTTLLQLNKQSFDKYAPYDSDVRQELERVAHERIAQTLRRYKIPLLSAIPLDKFGLLSRLSKIQYFAAGEVVLRPGDSKSALYVIAHGKIGVYVTKQRRQSVRMTPTTDMMNKTASGSDNQGYNNINNNGNDSPPTKGHQLNGINESANIDTSNNKNNNNNNNNNDKQSNNDTVEKKDSNKNDTTTTANSEDNKGGESRSRKGTVVIDIAVDKIASDGKHHQTKSSTKTPIAQTLLAVTDRGTASQNENLVRLSFLAAKAQEKTEAIKILQQNYNTLLSVYDAKQSKKNLNSKLNAPSVSGNNSNGGGGGGHSPNESKDSITVDDSYSQNNGGSGGSGRGGSGPQYVDNIDNVITTIETKAKSDPTNDASTNNSHNRGVSDEIRNGIEKAMKSVKFGQSADLTKPPSIDTEHARTNSQPIAGGHSSRNTQVSIASLLERDEDVEKLRGKTSRRSSRAHNSRGSVPVFTAENIARINDEDDDNDGNNNMNASQKFNSGLEPIHSENEDNDTDVETMDVAQSGVPPMPPPSGSDKKPKKFEKLVSTSAMMDDNNDNNNSNNDDKTYDQIQSQSLINKDDAQDTLRTYTSVKTHSGPSTPNGGATPTETPKSTDKPNVTTNNSNNNSNNNNNNNNNTSTNTHLSAHINENNNNNNSNSSEAAKKATSTIEDRRARRARSKASKRNVDGINLSDAKNLTSTSSNLRDFQAEDGTQYTEIEVSILSAGHYFGETSLMDEEELDDDDDDVDFNALSETEKAQYLNDKKEKQKNLLARNARANKSHTDVGNSPSTDAATSPQDAMNSDMMNTLSGSTSEMGSNGKRKSGHKRRKSKKGLIDDNNNNSLNTTNNNNKDNDDIDDGTNKRKKVKYKGSAPTFRCKTNCVVFSIDKASFEEFFALVPEARPWFNIMLSRYNVEMDTVLLIPKATRYFTLFLESEYAEENIHFYLAVCDFKESFERAEQSDIEEMASLIGQVFIATTAEQQVNIAGNERKHLLKRIKNKDISIDMFDASQKAIYKLLERDCFPRFKQSNFFQSFLTSVEEWNLTQEEEEERKFESKLLEKRRNSAFEGISPKQSVRASAFTSKGQFLPSSLTGKGSGNPSSMGRTFSSGNAAAQSPLMYQQDSENAFKNFDDRNRAKTTM